MNLFQRIDVEPFLVLGQVGADVGEAVTKSIYDGAPFVLHIDVINCLPGNGVDALVVPIPRRRDRLRPLPLPLENLPQLSGMVERDVKRVVLRFADL